MPRPGSFENIEAMRLEAGMSSISLREDIRKLRAGDLVKLTARVSSRPPPGESLLVRVTSVGGGPFAADSPTRRECRS